MVLPQTSIRIIWRSLRMSSEYLPWRAERAGKTCGFRDAGSHSFPSAFPANSSSSSVSFSFTWKTLEEVQKGDLNLKHSDDYGTSSTKCHSLGHLFLCCPVAASALFLNIDKEYSAQQRQTSLSKVSNKVLGKSPKQQPWQSVQIYLSDIPQTEALDFTNGFLQSFLLLFPILEVLVNGNVEIF